MLTRERITQYRRKLLIGICCVLMLRTFASYAQQSEFHYEIVAHLEMPGATQAAWSPDGSLLAVSGWHFIQIWDTETWTLLRTIPDAFLYDMKWSPSGDRLAGSIGTDHEEIVFIWSAETGKLV